jgi:hypothetical protein
MKEIKVKCISESTESNSIGRLSDLLDTFDRQKLENAPWAEFPDKPKISFAISYNSSNIFLKYYVEEKHIRAENITINSAVYEDSCVEFFVSFDEGVTYYNFEFNCIGTCLAGYGCSKDQRQLLEETLIGNLKSKYIIYSENEGKVNWQLTLAIPLATFVHTSVKDLSGMSCRANFYKCGNLLPEQHFISWSNIIAEEPNFHLPQFFGRLQFEQT